MCDIVRFSGDRPPRYRHSGSAAGADGKILLFTGVHHSSDHEELWPGLGIGLTKDASGQATRSNRMQFNTAPDQSCSIFPLGY